MAPLPKLAFSNLPSPPPSGALQFFDGYFSALGANTYTITLNHVVAPNTANQQTYTATQQFTVQAPEFSIDTTIVQSAFPPAGGSDVYGEALPFIVLTDPALPWERDLVPDGATATPGNPTPWMALMIFAEGELLIPSGTNNPVVTTTVQQLINGGNDTTLTPQLPSGWVTSQDVLASQCQTITITGAAFNAVMPQTNELPFLAHCRGVAMPDESEALLSVLIANRLPVATGGQPVRFYAHLVSLEGFASYLGPNAQPLPTQPGTQQPKNVQLVSLYNWTFVSLPEPNLNFEQLVQGLIASEQATPVLALPIPSGQNPPQSVRERLQDGYAPLTFIAGSGDESFAWYRGPLSAVVPQPLPQVGESPVPVAQATNADELMIYLASQGLFDLSYAAAWNLGRNLALADAQFAQELNETRRTSNSALNTLSQRMALPHFAGEDDPRALLARDATRRSFSRSFAAGLGRTWNGALASTREGAALAAPRTPVRPRPARRRGRIHPRTLLASPDVVEAIGENVAESADAVARWLANLSLLYSVPFSYLVPNPAMLPIESVRFFYVDQGWIDALVAGATSIAIHNSGDVAMMGALRPMLHARMGKHRRAAAARAGAAPSAEASGTAASGILIRSQLIAGWPQLVITATLGGAPVRILRDEVLSPTVRFTLFDGIPDTVTLAEPYQGLQFGVEDNSQVFLRTVTDPDAAGAQIANVSPVTATTRTPASGAVGGVLNIVSLAPALATAAGVRSFGTDAVVSWNGTALKTTFVSANTLTATVPASLLGTTGTASVTVTTGGATSAPATFLIDPALIINSLSPDLAIVGSSDLTLSVKGAGFDSGTVVYWGSTALKTNFISVNEVTATVPASLLASPGTATITAVVSGVTTNGVPFSVVTANPVLSTLAPALVVAGSPGFTLIVTGSELGSDAVVQWNGSPLATTFVSDGEVKAAVPAALVATAGSASVTVVTQGATSNALTFTIAGKTPVIGNVQPAAAMAGGAQFTVTVDGVNFGSDAVVKWNGTALKTTFDDAGQVTAVVPASSVASAGDASVTVTSGGATSPAVTFPVLAPQPVIGLLDPSLAVAGSGDLTLTVYGGFGAGDFALQMVKAPERQSFTPQNG